jgi:prophage regulatory protein
VTSGLEVKVPKEETKPFGNAIVVREPWKLIGIGRHTWRLMRKRSEVPAPIKLGRRAIGWRASDLEKWLRERQQERI